MKRRKKLPIPSTIIQLTQGFKTIVDKKDLPKVSKYFWHVLKLKNGNTNYARTTINCPNKRQTISMHRFILNAKKGQEVDHINTNGLDNRRSNIRICTRIENCMNSKKIDQNKRKTSSVYKGVSFDRENNKYRARIKYNGKLIYLGRFKNEYDAAESYNQAAAKLFGKFAKLNKINTLSCLI